MVNMTFKKVGKKCGLKKKVRRSLKQGDFVALPSMKGPLPCLKYGIILFEKKVKTADGKTLKGFTVSTLYNGLRKNDFRVKKYPEHVFDLNQIVKVRRVDIPEQVASVLYAAYGRHLLGDSLA